MSTPGITELELPVEACARALPTVEPATYDCIQSNLAVLANAAHGPGASHRLGAQLVVSPRPLGNGLSTVDPEPTAEVERCARLLGFATDAGAVAVPAGGLHERVIAAGGVCYAVGDAFELPWLPYFGRAHMPHSFLVAARAGGPTASIVDAYDNRTEWGAAEPGVWDIPWSELSFPARLWTWRTTSPRAPLRTLVRRDGIGPYVAAFRTHGDRGAAWEQLAVETWLLARRHKLFALAHDHTDVGPAARRLAADWERLAADVFLTCRRVRRGRPETTGALDETERLLTARL